MIGYCCLTVRSASVKPSCGAPSGLSRHAHWQTTVPKPGLCQGLRTFARWTRDS